MRHLAQRYRKSVSRLTALNVRDLNNSRGQYRARSSGFLPDKGYEEQRAGEQGDKDYCIRPARNWCGHQAKSQAPE